jgi:hypothetical protein
MKSTVPSLFLFRQFYCASDFTHFLVHDLNGLYVDRREYAQDIIVSSHCLLQNDIRYDDYSQTDRQRVSTSAEQIGKHIHT